jgi:magnesium transporter
MHEQFGIDPAALDDAAKGHQRPKVDVYEDFLFIVFYELDVLDGRPQTREVNLFVGENYLVTVHDDFMLPTIAKTAKRWREDVAWRGTRNTGALVYALLDAIVESYFPIIEELVDTIDDLEDRIFDQGDQGAQKEIFALKRNLLAIRRLLAPERDVLNMLVRPDSQVFGEEMIVYFHDVSDHILRVTEAIDTYRELLSSALDAFLSVSSNRLNQVVKTLTSSSIILMSVTLIAGIYGMNFAHMPELDWRLGYPLALGLMGVVAGGLLVTFRRIDWF